MAQENIRNLRDLHINPKVTFSNDSIGLILLVWQMIVIMAPGKLCQFDRKFSEQSRKPKTIPRTNWITFIQSFFEHVLKFLFSSSIRSRYVFFRIGNDEYNVNVFVPIFFQGEKGAAEGKITVRNSILLRVGGNRGTKGKGRRSCFYDNKPLSASIKPNSSVQMYAFMLTIYRQVDA